MCGASGSRQKVLNKKGVEKEDYLTCVHLASPLAAELLTQLLLLLMLLLPMLMLEPAYPLPIQTEGQGFPGHPPEHCVPTETTEHEVLWTKQPLGSWPHRCKIAVVGLFKAYLHKSIY